MRSSIQNRLFFLFPAFFLLSISFAWAQTGTTSLHGKVLDSTRAVVEGSSVTLANQATGALTIAKNNLDTVKKKIIESGPAIIVDDSQAGPAQSKPAPKSQ